eukprot:TRINITY_DN12691_c0_g1_i3.p1 TRINITY_DN12691_c0_g1~~TRINITY_DN12691_c0_g1_i3.p1  ORF type:complete len:371 (+),score=38.06 TRINITY_DN12691_c0_g1_i3:608-1720(+)
MIGISIIDCQPMELLQISFRNLKLNYVVTEEKVQNLNKMATLDLESSGFSTHLSAFNTIKLQEESSIINTNELIQISVDSFYINNQLIDTQFPVLLAPNRKMKQNQIIPVIYISMFSKQINESKRVPIKYIQTLQICLDTIEIRFDDYILAAILNFNSQLSQAMQRKVIEEHLINLIDTTNIDQMATNIIEANINQSQLAKYIKTFKLEPIEITFSFKPSPGHKKSSSVLNVLANFGLTLIAIDQAKIKLNSLFMNHIFGSKGQIIEMMIKHYMKQIISQILKIFGQFDVIGNPISLIGGLGVDVFSMFYDPISAFMKGKGSLKIGKKFTKGMFQSYNKDNSQFNYLSLQNCQYNNGSLCKCDMAQTVCL